MFSSALDDVMCVTLDFPTYDCTSESQNHRMAGTSGLSIWSKPCSSMDIQSRMPSTMPRWLSKTSKEEIPKPL